jgi:hypothetical protein
MQAKPGLPSILGRILPRRPLFSNARLLFLASIVLSVASYYTTYLGLKQYVAADEAWLAASITFGLQAIMFAVAWLAAESLATSFRAFVGYLIIYTVCALVSIFFSFSSLFNSIFDEQQRDLVNADYVRKFYQETVVTLDDGLTVQATAMHRDILSGAEFADFRRNVDGVMGLGRAAPDILSRRFAAEQTRIDGEIARLSTELAAENARQQALMAERSRIERLIAEIDATATQAGGQIDADRKSAADLRARILVLEAQMEAELKGVGSAPGEGPAFRRLRDERNALQRELIPIEARLSVSTSNPDPRLAERDRLASALQVGAADLGQADARIAALNRQLEDARRRQSEAAPANTLDVSQSIAAVEESLRQAATDPQSFSSSISKVVAQCSTLLGEIRADPQMAGDAALLNCDPGQLQIVINSLQQLVERRSEFRQRCVATDVPVGGEGEIFTVIAQGTEACITLAGPANSDLRSELAFLISSRGPTAHPFVIAQNALFIDRLPVSYMAAVIATVIDLLILLVALMAQMSNDKRRENAIRSLLEVDTEDKGNGKLFFVHVRPGTYNHAERRRLQQELVGLNLAFYDPKEDKLYLSAEARQYLFNLLRQLDA